jgi:hypothetical protein
MCAEVAAVLDTRPLEDVVEEVSRGKVQIE